MTETVVERFLRLTGAWADAQAELDYRDAVLTVARQDGVTVTDDELQEGVDRFREGLGLFDAAETETWLAEQGLDLEDVEREVEVRLLNEKLHDRLDRRQVEAQFQQQRIRFDTIRLKVMITSDAAHGRTLAQQMKDDWPAHDDAELERRTGMTIECGWFVRDDLPEQAATAVFRARPGDVVGPVQVGEHVHAVYCVEQVRPASFDAALDRQMRAELVLARTDMVLNPDDPRRFVLK